MNTIISMVKVGFMLYLPRIYINNYYNLFSYKKSKW